MTMMNDLGNYFWCAGDLMLVNFWEIYELAVLVFEFGETLVINNYIVNEYTFGSFVSAYFDA